MASLKELKQLAVSSHGAGKIGDPEAQFLLGSCYGMGALSARIDHRRAFQWYFQASKHGHAEATYRTAVCYELGIGTETNGDCAVTFYRKGAHMGHVPSMYKLGIIMMRGYCDQPVAKKEAVTWLQRAVSEATRYSTAAAATLQSSATSSQPTSPSAVPSTTNTSLQEFETAASTTTRSVATTNSSTMKTSSQATSLLSSNNPPITSSVTHRDVLPYAMHALAMVHLSKECRDTNLIPDPKYAIHVLLREAARMGHAPSQYKIGESYECGYHCPEDEVLSIYWYTLAAQQDYPEACLALSGWYLTGSIKTDTLRQSDKEAYSWAARAASLANDLEPKTILAKAYYTLGSYHENGIGVVKSAEMATKYFKRAAQLGHSDAARMYRERKRFSSITSMTMINPSI